jgi:hypothetical protein
MTIDLSQANGAAGSTYYPLNFTNRSTKACERRLIRHGWR